MCECIVVGIIGFRNSGLHASYLSQSQIWEMVVFNASKGSDNGMAKTLITKWKSYAEGGMLQPILCCKFLNSILLFPHELLLVYFHNLDM